MNIYEGKRRGYVVAYKEHEMTDPMTEQEAEMLKQKWSAMFQGLTVKEVIF